MSESRSCGKDSLSEAQFAAVSAFGSDVAVSAAAGSGKTSVLVCRFVRAVVEEKTAPGDILAITFTDKAANVMKRRLVAEFARLGREEDRRALETAYIGTIHAFCMRLLRENPVEAGIDPYFKVLSEGESDLLMTKALDAVFEAQADRPDWLAILSERGEKRTRSALLGLYAHVRAAGDEDALLALKDFSAERKRAEKDLLSHLAVGKTLAASGGSTKPAGNETATLRASEEVPAILKKPLDETAFLRVRALLSIDKRGKKMKEWASELDALFGRWQGPALQALFEPKKEEFLRVYRLFCDAVEREKRTRAVLDFDDLPLLALALLGGGSPAQKAVRERYRAKFKHVFVDEFQDTNPLQARLIDLVRGKNNFFFVGDPRQSIYSFRHAEPALFSAREAEAEKRFPLSENYRSRAAVLGFANAFFAPGGFEPLVPAKKFALEDPGAVEMLRVDFGEGCPAPDLESARVLEAELLAARLRELVDSGARVEDGTVKGRPMRWGDVAILFRGTTQAPVFERALAKAGIPFYSVKSKGFYDRPEVQDFIHFLALLDRPDDDVALAGVLRSPLAGVSDDGLFWLARSVKKERRDPAPLARALDAPGKAENLSSEDRARTEVFRDFLEETRVLKNSLTVSALLERAAAWSGYECAALTRPGGMQAVANVRKLVESARSLEEKAAFDSAEFVRYVRALAERDEGDAEARVEAEGGDAVLLMSIHAAKGLEFPCVVLADLGRKQRNHDAGFAIASHEFGFGWSEPDSEDESSKKKLIDSAHLAAGALVKARLQAEEDRVLYVGMTRAEERLILLGSRSQAGTWIARLSDFADGPSGKGLGVQIRVAMPAARAAEAPTAAFAPVAAPLEKILARLSPPKKAYGLALDLTVTDLVVDGAEPKYSEEPEAVDLEDVERSPRNEFGTLFHRLMEAGTLARPCGSVSAEFRESLLAPLTAAEREEATGAAAKFWKGKLGAEIRRSDRVYPELPFIYKTKSGILKGQIDLVYRDADGKWVILDYKTNRVTADTRDAVAEGYRFQLELYAFVFRELFGEAPAQGALYFSTIGEEVSFSYSGSNFETIGKRLTEKFAVIVAARAGEAALGFA